MITNTPSQAMDTHSQATDTHEADTDFISKHEYYMW